MKITLPNKTSLTLTQKDYIANGGEAVVYAKNNIAYKIYTDHKRLLPLGKVQELSVLTHPGIIKPEEVVFVDGNPAGFSMKYVKNTYSLCQTFTKAFKDRNKFTTDTSVQIVRNLQELVTHVHSKNILIVDLNELNFLLSEDFKEIFAIDVDSWATPHFPATAILPTVKDPHATNFSQSTDWFAFAIVSFQVLVNIHPYRGTYQKLNKLEDRMKQNVSVLNKDVRVPAACYPFSVIPPVYLDWYKALFEEGKRLPPPKDLHATASIISAINKIVGSNNFHIEELESFDGQILDVIYHNGSRIAQTDKSVSIGRLVLQNKNSKFNITLSPSLGHVIYSWVERGELKLYDATLGQMLFQNIEAEHLMTYDGRIYFKDGSHIFEIQYLNESHDNKNLTIFSKIVANVMEQATILFDGVVVQNVLGSAWISYFPEKETEIQVRVKELDGYKIIDAKFDKNVLMVVGAKKGTYDRFIFRFFGSNYDVRIINKISPTGLNFVVLDTGICVSIDESDNVEIFPAKKDAPGIKVIDDSEVNGSMKLFHHGAKVLAARDNKLYSMTMKKN